MDYEKKYKEALKRAKIELNADTTQCTKNVLMTIFPELKNEDERIRKRLIDLIYKVYANTNYITCVEHENMLAWLKKQGNHKPVVVDFKAKDWYVSKVDGKIHNIYYSVDKVEPKFKVKYAGSEYNVLEVKDIAGVTFYGIEDEPNHIDYVKAENCEIISGYAIKENGSPYPTKPAVFLEQKPAWSEKDERMLRDVISYAEHEISFKNTPQLNWLKSLKDKYTWKPSEEHIKVCKEVYADMLSAKGFDLGTVNSELNRLEEKLKKLREE